MRFTNKTVLITGAAGGIGRQTGLSFAKEGANIVVTDLDYDMAKRVADEIVRMSTNLSRMDDSIRGFKQLSASVKKLIQSLNINEYEIVELLNKSYSPGMNLEANFIFNEDIEKGSAIITRIIKPQINYKGKMIQGAQVEVSQND